MCVKIQEFCANCETYFITTWDIENDGWIIQCPNCGEMVYVCSMCPNKDKCCTDECNGKIQFYNQLNKTIIQ